ncbi:MAG TPA: protein-L-isoaspartate O-methyltransferase [Devosia sp.]|nr:protein-L-isoaspartate O-methyltransferase [Devosia sp.]
MDFVQARKSMVEGQLMTSGVLEPRVLGAMGAVPREEFVDETQKSIAYLDVAHRLAGPAGRFMAAPVVLGKMIELAEIGDDDIVLDVACGTGYSTAVIARLANSVVAVETDEAMVARANQILARLDVGNAAVIKAPLKKGAPAEAQFDVIIIEGAVGAVPQALFDQLRVGGRLVALLGDGASATAVLHVKGEEEIARVEAFNASLPPLRELFPKPAFTL